MNFVLEPLSGEGYRFTTTVGSDSVMVDTGSSTLALCPSDSEPSGASAASVDGDPVYACNLYGDGDYGFIGQFYVVPSLSWGNLDFSDVSVAMMYKYIGTFADTACDDSSGVGMQGCARPSQACPRSSTDAPTTAYSALGR